MNKGIVVFVGLSILLTACGKNPSVGENADLSTLAANNFSTSYTQEYWNDAAGSSTGVFTVGQSTGSPAATNKGGIDAVVFKYDFNGNVLWKKQLTSAANDSATDVAVNPGGQVYVLGATDGKIGARSNGQRDVFVTRYDADGKNPKTVQLGGAGYDDAVDIVLDKNQVPYILMSLDDGADYTVYKGDPTTFRFTKLAVKSQGAEKAKALGVDTTGNIYVLVDYKRVPDTVVDINQFSSSGQYLDYVRASSVSGSLAQDLRFEKNDLYVSYTAPDAAGKATGYLKKLKDLTVAWEVNLGTSYVANTVKVAGDAVYLGGLFGGQNYVASYSTAGKKIWSETFSTPTATGYEGVYGVATAAQNNAIYPAGFGYAGSADGFVMRMNAANGDLGWLRQ
jgi:hypothetical protein